MSDSPYQFLTEVQKSVDVSGSWQNVYPFSYEVSFVMKDSTSVYVTEYRALSHKMIEQVEKRWEYDYKDIDAYLLEVNLKPEFITKPRRDIN